MNEQEFIQSIERLKTNLVNIEVNRAFNSIGTNIFIEFGKEQKIMQKNGREWVKKEWCIWIGNTSWRITKDENYIVGSEDLPELIQEKLQSLLGQRFQSLDFLSSFLDVNFNFENGYKITTFFYWVEENQWTIFYPDETNISVECSCLENIREIQYLSKNFAIVENYENWEASPIKNSTVKEVIYDETYPVIVFDNQWLLDLEYYAWRLEREGDYVTGSADEYFKKEGKLSQIVGKKIGQIDVANNNMDYRILFDDGYCLKLFSRCAEAVERLEVKLWAGLKRRSKKHTERLHKF